MVASRETRFYSALMLWLLRSMIRVYQCRSEEHTSELQSRQYLVSFPTRRSSDLRVRRRLREIVRQHQHDLRQDFWIVLIAKRDAANASYRALEDEWLRLARRASILL